MIVAGASVRIVVGNIDWAITADALHHLFYGYGTVESVQMLTDRETGRPRGFGFVEMPNATAAQAAIEGLNGTSLGGRALTVTEARQREGQGRPRRPRGERPATSWGCLPDWPWT
jgi:cold-inducible RNA-binding protein